MIRRTSSASLASRTKLSAMKSTVRCSAKRRSSMSFSDSAGTETATPGRLMPLWLLTLPPTSTSVLHVLAVDLGHPQPDLAVVDEDRVAGVDVAGQPGVRRAAILVVAGHVAGGDRPLLAAPQRDRAVGEGRQPDLRALEVGEDADAVPARVRGLAHEAVGLGVVLVACRGSCSAGRRPCRRTPARGSAAGRRWPGRGCRRSWLYARRPSLADSWNVPTPRHRVAPFTPGADPAAQTTQRALGRRDRRRAGWWSR